MTIWVTDMTHIYEQEYDRIGLRWKDERPVLDSAAQNAAMRAYAESRGWPTVLGNHDFIHDEDKFREALRWALAEASTQVEESPAA